MASEIRVDKINSLSGVGTVTLSPTGVDIAGITTAATLRATTGIVTSLTAVSSAKVGSGVTLSPDGDIFATGVTTSTTFVGNLTGNVTGTLQTAAQTNITSVGSLSSLVVTGGITATGGNIVMNDSSGSSANRIKLGTSQDLSIYHDASHSRIVDSGTGNLILQTSKININNADGTEGIIHGTAGGAVEIYHANSKKVETNSTGINIVDKVITFQGQSNRRIAYRDGENDILFEFDSGDFMRQDIGNNRHEFFVGNTKRVSVTSDGLTFGSDTAAANALDDYEEGTWTPVPGTGTVTLGTGGAKYTKIGRVVFCQFDINYSGSGSSSSGFSLPFNSASIYGSGVVGWTNKGYPLQVHVQATAFAIMDNSASAGSSSQHATYDELNGTRFIGDFRYFIA